MCLPVAFLLQMIRCGKPKGGMQRAASSRGFDLQLLDPLIDTEEVRWLLVRWLLAQWRRGDVIELAGH